jgi:hypothetical protein
VAKPDNAIPSLRVLRGFMHPSIANSLAALMVL